jgi:hypothetical protein
MVKEPLGQTLAWQKDSAVNQTSPRIKTRKHGLRTVVMETDTVSRWRVVPSSNYPTSAYSDARAERKPAWSDVQALIDRSWNRCKDGCWQRR